MEVAKIIREDFLQHNGFSVRDFLCPLARTIGMMTVIVGFHESPQQAMAAFSSALSWVRLPAMTLLEKITDMKFEQLRQPEEHYTMSFSALTYAGVTESAYDRDQGCNVAMRADSTSCW